MVTVLFFAQAREATGTRRVEIDGDTVGAVLDAVAVRFGDPFTRVLAISRVWRNGEPATREDRVSAGDEVAVLPPVSGG